MAIRTDGWNGGTDCLSKHLLNVLLSRWDQQRKAVEAKWRRNFAAYSNSIRFDAATWGLPKKAKAWQSDTFPDLTAQKCNSGFAILSRTVFAGNRVNFTLTADDVTHRRAFLGGADQVQPLSADAVNSAASGMQALMDRQSEFFDEVEELQSAALAGAVYGEGAVEDFVGEMREESVDQQPDGSFELVKAATECLGVQHVSIWAIWRDRESKRITDGDGYCIYRPMSVFDLAKLLHDEEADRDVVRQILDRHRGTVSKKTDAGTAGADVNGTSSIPQDNKISPAEAELVASGRAIDSYRFQCRVPLALLRAYVEERQSRTGEKPETIVADEQQADGAAAAGAVESEADEPADADGDFEAVEITALICDGRVVRVVESDARDRNLRVWEWERTVDSPYATGVADRVEPQQRSLVKAVRALEDKIYLSQKIRFAGKREKIDGDFDASGGDDFIQLDPSVKNVNEALTQFSVPAETAELHQWIGYIMQMADLTSLIPRIAQGQADGSDPTTLGEILKRLEMSGEWMLRVASNFDRMVEDIKRAQYLFNLGNPAVPKELKGNFKIKAQGSQTFQNRYFRSNEIAKILTEATSNPQLSAITKIADLWRDRIRSSELDSDLIVMTATEMQQHAEELSAQQQQNPQQGEGGALAQAQIARLMAEAQNKQADTALKQTQAQANQSEMLIRKAEAVSKLRVGSPIPPEGRTPAASGPPQVPVTGTQ